MTDSLDFREHARDHLDRAREHLRAEQDHRLRYAALEQRMCIEALAYDLLRLHRSEASYSLMRRWQADQVLKELSEMVRGVTGERKVEINFEGADPISATEYRMELPWARKNYQSLGSFLHSPTVREMEAGEEATFQRIRSKCAMIQEKLTQILASEMFNITIDRKCQWICDFDGCTFVMERDIDWFASNNVTSCPKCEAEHNAWLEDGRVWHKIRTADWICRQCGMKNSVARHRIKDRSKIACRLCKEQYEFRQEILLYPMSN